MIYWGHVTSATDDCAELLLPLLRHKADHSNKSDSSEEGEKVERGGLEGGGGLTAIAHRMRLISGQITKHSKEEYVERGSRLLGSS